MHHQTSFPGMRRIAFASFIGALLEWYDFYAYSTASALVLGPLFFPGAHPTLDSFAALATGFVARPVGGLIFGHIGDRLGRKTSLVATLTIIGIGTAGIGLLPTREQIGIAAPILLVTLRVLQGIGLGGEYGGAALMTIEHAPRQERGFWGSLPQAASPGGLLLAALMFSLVQLLPHGAFLAWGWRIPFLLSVVMLAVGLFIRLHVPETPAFRHARQDPDSRPPALELMRDHKRCTMLALTARLAETVSGNMIKTFGLSYVAVHLHMRAGIALDALMGTAVVALVATPLFGLLADRYGRQRLYLIGSLCVALLAFPFFRLLEIHTPLTVWIGFVAIYTLGPTLMLSVQPTFFAGLFRTRVRYTALSVAYQASSILGGATPLISEALLHRFHGLPWGVAGFLCATGLVSAVAVQMAPWDGDRNGGRNGDRDGDRDGRRIHPFSSRRGGATPEP